MTVYRIKDWGKHFENNRSKAYDKCTYVCMPNKQDGMGLQRILATPNGAALFGIWCLFLQKASRQRKGCRDGWFTDDGKPDGQPWDFTEMAFQWRQDPTLLESAIALFTDPRIGWAEAYSGQNRKKQMSAATSALTVPTSAAGSALTLGEGSTALGEAVTDLERKKERKKERTLDGDGDETGGIEPTTEPITESDETLLHLVRSRIRWQVKDPDVQAQHQASILTWLRSPDRKLVIQIADKEFQLRRKAIAWWELEEILIAHCESAAPEIAQPAGYTLQQMMDAYPEIRDAHTLMKNHGWEWARGLWGYTAEQMPDEAAALKVLRTDISASDELLRKATAGT